MTRTGRGPTRAGDPYHRDTFTTGSLGRWEQRVKKARSERRRELANVLGTRHWDEVKLALAKTLVGSRDARLGRFVEAKAALDALVLSVAQDPREYVVVVEQRFSRKFTWLVETLEAAHALEVPLSDALVLRVPAVVLTVLEDEGLVVESCELGEEPDATVEALCVLHDPKGGPDVRTLASTVAVARAL